MRKMKMSSVARKTLMAVSGAFMVLFLLFHGAMNLVSVFSEEGYEAICNFLGANWYAVAGTMVIALFFVIHLVMAFVLSLQNYMARGRQRYKVTNKDASWDVRNMLVIGLFVLLGLVMHLYQFWAKMQLAEILGGEPASGIERIKFIFSNDLYSILYLVWIAVIYVHLAHGVPSVMQSVGWSNKVWKRRIEIIGKVFAALVMLMFATVVIYYWLIY